MAVYALSFGSLLLFAGRLADAYGRRLLFLIGSVFFAVVSLATAFCPSEITFFCCIGALGIGPALNSPAGVGIFGSHFPDGKAKNRAFAALGSGQPLGFIAGLILGGLFCQSPLGWRAIFYFQSALAFAFTAAGWWSLPKDERLDRSERRLDWIGAFLSTSGLVLLTFALADGQSAPQGWKTPYIPALLPVSVLLLASFIQWESRQERLGRPVIIPTAIWSRPRVGAILGLTFTAWWSFNTLMYLSTLFFQQVQHLSPIQTSLRFISLAVSGIVVNVLTGYYAEKVSGQLLIVVGLLGGAAAPLIFALVKQDISFWAMMFIVMITCAMNDAAYIVGNLQLCSVVDRRQQALVGGLFATTTRMATSIGLAVTSAISTAISAQFASDHGVDAASAEALLAGYRVGGWVCFSTSMLALVIASIGLWNIGIVGSQKIDQAKMDEPSAAIELTAKNFDDGMASRTTTAPNSLLNVPIEV